MKEKIFSFRWDIDHLLGLEKGIPNILSVCKEFDVKCTFFINLGKAFNLRVWLFQSLRKSLSKLTDKASINIIQKLGYQRLFRLVVFNPNVGLSRIDLLKKIIDEGHELGLHGAGDHMLWSRRIKEFDSDRIETMLRENILLFERILDVKRFGFAAPGFSWNNNLLESIDKLNFVYTGDLPGDIPFYPKVDSQSFRHLCIPVTVIGPKTVPIIEYYSALGKSEQEISGTIINTIENQNFSVIYGHPVFEGFKTDILRKLFSYVCNSGYRILTHADIYKEFKDSAPECNVRE